MTPSQYAGLRLPPAKSFAPPHTLTFESDLFLPRIAIYNTSSGIGLGEVIGIRQHFAV